MSNVADAPSLPASMAAVGDSITRATRNAPIVPVALLGHSKIKDTKAPHPHRCR
jgi:hypothetical protein